jgi:hypothetical protein
MARDVKELGRSSGTLEVTSSYQIRALGAIVPHPLWCDPLGVVDDCSTGFSETVSRGHEIVPRINSSLEYRLQIAFSTTPS